MGFDLAKFKGRLRALRKRKGVSRVEDIPLIKDFPATQGTYNRWEHCKKAPFSITQLAELADYFGCSMDYICGRVDHEHGLPVGKFVIDVDLVQRIQNAKSIEEVKGDARIVFEAGVFTVRFSRRIPDNPGIVLPEDFDELNNKLHAKLMDLHRRAVGESDCESG